MKKLNTATLKSVGACALFFAASAAFAANGDTDFKTFTPSFKAGPKVRWAVLYL